VRPQQVGPQPRPSLSVLLVCASPACPGDQRLAGGRRARRPVVHQQVPRRPAPGSLRTVAASSAHTRRPGPAGRVSRVRTGEDPRQVGLVTRAGRLQRRHSGRAERRPGGDGGVALK
jgi:hypothetical protein